MKVILKYSLCLISGLFLPALSAYCGPRPSYQPGMAANESKLAAPLQPPANAVAKDSIKVTKDVSLYYETRGKGTRVLFVHGGPGIPNKPEGGMTQLKGKQVYFYHARGTGKSTRPVDKFEDDSWFKNPPILEKKVGMSAQLADIERIRRALGEEKLTLIGLSYGGLISTLYAVEFPQNVKSLVLINPAPLKFNADDSKTSLYAVIGEKQPKPEQKKAYGEYMQRFFKTFEKLWLQDEASLRKLLAEIGPYYRRVAQQQGMKLPARIPPEWMGGWHSFALFLSVGKEYDYTKVVQEKVKVPVLLLLGDNDITPLSAYEAHRQALPGRKEIIIKGAGHFPHVDKPAEFSRVVNEFLK